MIREAFVGKNDGAPKVVSTRTGKDFYQIPYLFDVIWSNFS